MFDNDKNFWLSFWALVSVTVMVLILCATYYSVEHVNLMTTNGYTQRTLVGADYPRWVKSDCK